MPLEPGTYLDDLVATNPLAGDPVSEGDDHIRLIKSVLLNSFPNISGAMTKTHTELNDLVSTPIGGIIAWPSNSLPAGNAWKECDGQLLDRTTYADLFAVIGTTYGTTLGTNFAVPDLRGQFIRGWDNSAGNDPDSGSRTAPSGTGATGSAGDNVGSEQSDDFASHNHSSALTPGGALGGGSNIFSGTAGSYPVSSTGGNETRPINIYMAYLIATGVT